MNERLVPSVPSWPWGVSSQPWGREGRTPPLPPQFQSHSTQNKCRLLKKKQNTSSCAHFYKSFKHMSLWEECKRAGRPISWMNNQYDDARLGDNPEGTTALRAPYLNFRFNKTAGFLHLFHINCCLALSPAHTSPPA